MTGITAAAVNSFIVGRGPATRFWHDRYYALKGLFRFAVSRGHPAVRCCGLTDHSACSGIARFGPTTPNSLDPRLLWTIRQTRATREYLLGTPADMSQPADRPVWIAFQG